MVEKSGITEEEVKQHYDACSISITHDIDNDLFQIAPEPLGVPMTCRTWQRHTGTASPEAICSVCHHLRQHQLAALSEDGRHIAIYANGHDVCECCSYMPADRRSLR